MAAVCGSLYNYGQTPDSGKFFLPDLRGRFIRGLDRGANRDANRTIASEQLSRNKRHTHTSTHSISGGDHSHAMRGLKVKLGTTSGIQSSAPRITLGSGQHYYIGFPTTDENTQASGTVIHDSGNLSQSLTLTINNDPVATTEDESRPVNIALIYIIKN